MTRKTLITGLSIFCIFLSRIFSFDIERIGTIEDIKYKGGVAGGPGKPVVFVVDERIPELIIQNNRGNGNVYTITKGRLEQKGECGLGMNYEGNYSKLGEYMIGGCSTDLLIYKNDKKIIDYAEQDAVSNGISFILKKGDGYIAYFVDIEGNPGAVDTNGKVYSSKEAMDYLKEYDPVKYEESSKRAAELHLAVDFEENDALVWGQTYYSTVDILEKYYGESPYIVDNLIQYDLQGYGYQGSFYNKKYKSYLCIVSPEGKRINITPLREDSSILSTYGEGHYFSYSVYAGFGGNIYYYIAGDEYTEVYRIRRTWGEPDLYAMAVNGYTDDSYGKYVKETLVKMSRADLRILRNTVYALYGCSFKSEELKTYFGRQVWYKDEGKNAGEIKLPEERKQLVEMIQTAEKK